jgi:hypothetical protein
VEVAAHEDFEDQHVERAGEEVCLWFICSHRRSEY